MKKRPTQSDVARLAGVSRATVSYVLNDANGKAPVSTETRARVLEVIEELGYQPDTRAQSLRSGDSKTIGLLIPDIHNPHFWQAVEGVENEARRAGYDVLLAHSDADVSLEDYCIQAISRRTISGLIVIRTTRALSPKTVKSLLASGRPIVEHGVVESQFDCIVSNYGKGTREVMRHLLDYGHQNFCFINGVSMPGVGVDRLDVYLQVLTEAGVAEPHRRIENCGITTEDGYQAALRVLNSHPRPSALVVINDLLAIGVLRAAADLGLRVPEDLSVASFDDLPVSRYLNPRLTSVYRDTRAEGQQAAKLLFERLSHPDLPTRTVEMPTRLVVRESTGPWRL
jgi:LacI family transcriptional regulator